MRNVITRCPPQRNIQYLTHEGLEQLPADRTLANVDAQVKDGVDGVDGVSKELVYLFSSTWRVRLALGAVRCLGDRRADFQTIKYLSIATLSVR